MNVIARETSFIPSGHEAIILSRINLADHTSLTKAVSFEPSQFFDDKQNVLVFNTFPEFQEDAIPARITNPGEDRTIYQVSTLGTITILEAGRLAHNNVTIEQKQKQSAINKYDLRSVLHQVKPVLNESSHAKSVQLLHDIQKVFPKMKGTSGNAMLCNIDFKFTKVLLLSNFRIVGCEMLFGSNLR